MKKKIKSKLYKVEEIKHMPLYTYECQTCHADIDQHVPLEDRNKDRVCGICKGVMKRKFTAPALFIGMAGAPHEGRPDEYWERSEKKKQKEMGKRRDVEAEQIKYNDKTAHKKLENAHANYSRRGDLEGVIHTENKLKGKTTCKMEKIQVSMAGTKRKKASWL